jgi:Tol biopolymer transport system component
MYFIRKTKREAASGTARLVGKYTLYPTDVMRMRANGSDRKRVYDAFIRRGGQWFTHVLQPSASPDGKTVAVVSDGPDGSGPVVLHVLNTRTGSLRRVETPSEGDFGHNDPDFSRDGKKIAFTYNDRKGTEGQPRIAIHSCRSRTNCVAGSTKYLKQGYANPSWSRDMSWLAAEETSGTGRDIVIVSAARGDVRVKLTDGGDSFAPEVSPDGDQIAYLHRDGTDMNVRVMTLDIDEKGKISLVSDRAVTTDGGVDGQSPISWHIPKERRSTPDASEEPDEAEATESDGVPDGAPPPPPGA